MADGLLSEITTSIEHAIAHAAKEMFGGGGPNPDSIRWEGMSNDQLARAVRLLQEGPGASAVNQAAQALTTIADNLAAIDQTLHDQLQAIGVNWQSTASELAQEMTTASAAYSGAAGAAGGTNSTGVTNQGDAFSAAKNAVPSVSDLQSPPGGSFLATAGGILTGHQNDNAAQAGRNQAARNAAIDAMQCYGNNSQTGLSSHQVLPPPPGIAVAPQPVAPGGNQVTSPSSFVPSPPPSFPGDGGGGGSVGFPGGGGPAGGSAGVPGQSSSGMPGPVSGAFPGAPGGGMPGGLPGVGGAPGAGGLPGGGVPGMPVVGVPGSGGDGGGRLAPGPVSGVGTPEGPVASGVPAASQAGAAVSGALIEDAAIGAAIVGGTAGAGIAGASARPDRLVRSRLAGEDIAADEGSGARQQAARALAELEGEEAEAAVVSERIGATAEPPASLLEPATGRRTDDETHDNRYGVEPDLFDDDRMVVPPVLDGSDPTESK